MKNCKLYSFVREISSCCLSSLRTLRRKNYSYNVAIHLSCVLRSELTGNKKKAGNDGVDSKRNMIPKGQPHFLFGGGVLGGGVSNRALELHIR